MAIYQIKITLNHTQPPIWRRIHVAADTKLGKLHRILQEAMGWEDAHLHAFRIGRTSYGEPSPDFPSDIENERHVRLDQIVNQGDALIYEYDFGDGWEHQLNVEKVLDPEPGRRYPLCLAGGRACPPEDCGGPPGYARLLDVLSDPKHEEHDDMRDWIGDDFDPEAFDLAEINKTLLRITGPHAK